MDKKGTIGTILFHGILLILFIFMGFKIPLPLPAEEGILINFGTSNSGRGQREPANAAPPKEVRQQQQVSVPQPSSTPETKENIATQNFEEAPAIEKTTPKKEVEKKEETPKVVENKPEVKKEEEKPPEVNKRALYSGKNKYSDSENSEGVKEGTGNQGSPTGSPLSDNHSQGLSQGSGGISFSLSGRNPVSLPKPLFNQQKQGKVVVEVTVDRDGNVTNANPGYKGSTTLDSDLLAAAKKAALSSKFDRKADAPAYQKGTITYYFVLD